MPNVDSKVLLWEVLEHGAPLLLSGYRPRRLTGVRSWPPQRRGMGVISLDDLSNGLSTLWSDAGAFGSTIWNAGTVQLPKFPAQAASDIAYNAATGQLSPSQIAAQTALAQNDIQNVANAGGNLSPDFVQAQLAAAAGDQTALANLNAATPNTNNLGWIIAAAVVTFLFASK